MRQVQAIIFDMDGVIVDSESRHERAFLEVVREIGYGDKLGLRFADYIGRSDQALWLDFVAGHKPSQTVGELLAMKRRRVVDLIRREQPLFDGLPELVEKLAARYALGAGVGFGARGGGGSPWDQSLGPVLLRRGQRLGRQARQAGA